MQIIRSNKIFSQIFATFLQHFFFLCFRATVNVVVESAENGQGIEYADIPIAPGTSVRSELLFDLKRDHVYVMTDKRLSKVKVQDCQQYTDCGQCLGARDPYCGWCSLENKCR